MSVVRFITLFSSLCLTVACGGGGGGGGGGDTTEIGGGGNPTGVFSLQILDEIDEDFFEFMRSNMEPRLDYVNRVAAIPKDIPVTVADCGIENAFYVLERENVEEDDLNGPAIFMCWELFYSMWGNFLEIFPESEDETEDDNEGLALGLGIGAYSFVLHHEMGHAFDDQLDLAIVGNTESAADGIASVLSIEQGAAIFAVAAALLFDTTDNGSFGAVHPGGADRAGDLFCWALGGDEEMAEIFPDLVQLFVDSGRDCVSEYAGQRAAVVSWLPGIDDDVTLLASNPARSILSADVLSGSTLEGLRKAVLESPTIKSLAGAQ